jgi:hypothetical protein
MWKQPNRPYLKYRKSLATVAIFDGRKRQEQVFSYHGLPADLYEYCAEARTPRDIAAQFGDSPSIEDALKDFVSKAVMLHLDGRYLSLALPENPYFDLKDMPERQAALVDQPAAELVAR